MVKSGLYSIAIPVFMDAVDVGIDEDVSNSLYFGFIPSLTLSMMSLGFEHHDVVMHSRRCILELRNCHEHKSCLLPSPAVSSSYSFYSMARWECPGV